MRPLLLLLIGPVLGASTPSAPPKKGPGPGVPIVQPVPGGSDAPGGDGSTGGSECPCSGCSAYVTQNGHVYNFLKCETEQGNPMSVGDKTVYTFIKYCDYENGISVPLCSWAAAD